MSLGMVQSFRHNGSLTGITFGGSAQMGQMHPTFFLFFCIFLSVSVFFIQTMKLSVKDWYISQSGLWMFFWVSDWVILAKDWSRCMISNDIIMLESRNKTLHFKFKLKDPHFLHVLYQISSYWVARCLMKRLLHLLSIKEVPFSTSEDVPFFSFCSVTGYIRRGSRQIHFLLSWSSGSCFALCFHYFILFTPTFSSLLCQVKPTSWPVIQSTSVILHLDCFVLQYWEAFTLYFWYGDRKYLVVT